jgi:hypothetical protein
MEITWDSLKYSEYRALARYVVLVIMQLAPNTVGINSFDAIALPFSAIFESAYHGEQSLQMHPQTHERELGKKNGSNFVRTQVARPCLEIAREITTACRTCTSQ